MIRIRLHPRQFAGALFMVVGAALLAYVGAILWAGSWMEARDRMKLAASFTQGVPLLPMRDPPHRGALPESGGLPHDGANVIPISASRRYPAPLGLGIVEIDRLGLAVLVRAGSSSADLDKGAGWISGTATPGESGNVAIAGHRDTFFRGLRGVKIGDQVRLQTASGPRYYTVTETMVIDPSNTSVLRPTEKPVLTLVTCFPFDSIGTAPKRFVVRAEGAM